MWCCDECNIRKGDLTPPQKARDAGYRFFRPDQDLAADHFELDGVRLKHRSSVGDFTIDYVDLNRLALRRLRDLRRRLWECEQFIQQGVFALRRSHIDILPAKLRGQVVTAIARAQRIGESIADQIDKVLREFAKSELIDPDPQSQERAEARKERLNQMQGIYEGKWRGRQY